MAIGVLVLGKPGTGKSYSMKSFSPDEVKILSVTKPILPNESGEVKVNSELWRAISFDSEVINEGDKVIINSFSGNKLLVSKIENSKENL